MERLNTRLQEASARRARSKRIEALLELAHRDLSDQRERLGDLRARLDKEQQDVDKLEGLSLTALFHTLLSSKQEQLKKERQELLQAKLQHDECRSATTELEQQVEGMRRQLEELAGVETQYQELLAQKEALLKREPGRARKAVLELSLRIGEEQNQQRELDEALSCADDVLAALAQVIASLESAKNWGTYDMLGGGLLATAIKHSKIDESRAAAHAAQGHMRRFKNELADVRLRSEVSIHIDGFSTFADYFLDGLIFDWVVQSKIVKSLEGSLVARQRVEETQAALHDLHLVTGRRLAELEEQRRVAVEQA